MAELLDTGLLGENFIPVLREAANRGWFAPRCRVLPARARVYAQLVESACLRRMATLDVSNTEPIRLTVDYSSLYQETAPPYSACFAVGDWFARGLPGPDPPSDGEPATS